MSEPRPNTRVHQGKTEQIKALVRIANLRATKIRKGGELIDRYTIDRTAGAWRLQTNDGSKNVSPRLDTSCMYWWLDGFTEGQMKQD